MKQYVELEQSAPQQSINHFLAWPYTRTGWSSGVMAVVFLVIFTVYLIVISIFAVPERLIPFVGSLLLPFWISPAVIGLVAVIRDHERSWFVWFAILIGMTGLALFLFELLVPH